ncbi:MAG: polysaccharide deacetylase family protein [Verrucomicrobiae bacterium]
MPHLPRLLLLFLLAQSAGAATWSYSWPPSKSESEVRASVCPLKYDKKWAYAIELDDGTVPTGTFAPDFFAEFQYTDAAPGVGKGQRKPVVGSLALFPYRVGANITYVNFDQVREICGKGWAVANHSYSHKGKTYGDVPEILTPEQIKDELFWSQAVFAHELGHAPTHFVYPNGYTAYADSLGAVGIASASSVGGKGGISLVKMGDSFLSIPRCYLDEGAWTNSFRKGNPMDGIPAAGPAAGDLIIDFTHNLSPDPGSANQKRWRERLGTLAAKFGADGTDEFWSAPTQDIIAYWRAAKVAEAQLAPGKLSVSLPDSLPGTPLTIRLDGVPAETNIPSPPGGSICRKDSTVWITTPVIGAPGAAALTPPVKQIYKGPPAPTIPLDSPRRIAAVRVRQHGNPTPDRQLNVNITLPDGSIQKFSEQTQPDGFISGTHVFSSVPNREAPLAKSVEITTDPSIKEVEIWAADDARR